MAKRTVNVGMWVFLSLIVVFIGAAGLLFLNNHLQTQRQLKIEQQKQAQEQEQQEASNNSEAFANALETSCLDEAYKTYKKDWERESKSLGRTDGKLPYELIEVHEQRYREAKEECKQ